MPSSAGGARRGGGREAHAYQLILVDVHMPRMNGFETTPSFPPPSANPSVSPDWGIGWLLLLTSPQKETKYLLLPRTDWVFFFFPDALWRIIPDVP